MPLYHFHARTPDRGDIIDEEGTSFPDDAAAEQEAVDSILELTRNAPLDWQGCAYNIHDADGRHIVTVWFNEVLARAGRTILGEERGRYIH